jgi:hypothetical protein
MTKLQPYPRYIILFSLVSATAGFAQVSTINSAVIQSRVFNDVPGAVFSGVNTYPTLVSLSEAGVSATNGFANRDVWQYSNNGTTPYMFGHNEYFTASFSLTLTDTADSPRKEAGFLLTSTSVGDIQFIVNSDGHEVVQFGGSSFFSFNNTYGITYHTGQTIHLSLTYAVDPNTGANALLLNANGAYSPFLDFGPTHGNGSLDIGDGSTLGGYFQIANDPNNPSNGGTAAFSGITIGPAVIPEPSALALMGLGILPFVFRRRR